MHPKELRIESNIMPGYRASVVLVNDYVLKLNNPAYVVDYISIYPTEIWKKRWSFDKEEPTLRQKAFQVLLDKLQFISSIDISSLVLEAGNYNVIGQVERLGFAQGAYNSGLFTRPYMYAASEFPIGLTYDFDNNSSPVGTDTFINLETFVWTSRKEMFQYIVDLITTTYPLYCGNGTQVYENFFCIAAKEDGANFYELNIKEVNYAGDPFKMYALILEKI